MPKRDRDPSVVNQPDPPPLPSVTYKISFEWRSVIFLNKTRPKHSPLALSEDNVQVNDFKAFYFDGTNESLTFIQIFGIQER